MLCLVAQSSTETPRTAAHQAPLSMEFSRLQYWNGLPCPLSGDLPNPGIEPGSPALQADSLPSEPAGKPENTGVGSLSLLQGIFPTQRSNPGALHCRRILYQLSYQGSPWHLYTFTKPDSTGWHVYHKPRRTLSLISARQPGILD